MLIKRTPGITDKLKILSQDSQYDLACSCGMKDDDRRHRSKDDKWIYPVAMPDGRKTFLFKTLVSNVCTNNCKYCPLRTSQDPRRCTLEPFEAAKTFMEYYKAKEVMGLFLSSGVIGNPDVTMERINKIASILRRQQFKGYIHLKIIPGASNAAIEEAVSLASAVSVNIETAGEERFKKLGTNKDYINDVIRPIKHISKLTAKGARFGRVKQTTQFIVGASDETDQEIVKYFWGLYKRLGMSRVYFSAYQRGLGMLDLPGERSNKSNSEMLTREHRLYQADWLIRKYGFAESDICFGQDGNLSLECDPKEIWAARHPEWFPVNINRADRFTLLRVPGLGHISVNRILGQRAAGRRIRSIKELGSVGKRLQKAQKYLSY